MKTLLTTSETRIRTSLLEVLHAQWREFGVPFHSAHLTSQLEVIDPEALLWCSLEFTPTEPRFAEGVHAWVSANRTRLNRQRLNKLAKNAPQDPRAKRWLVLDANAPASASPPRKKPTHTTKPLGNRADGPSTLLLRSRDTLGNDCRSFLIVQLIGHPRGVRLRDVANTTGYSYRSISEAATGWERAGIVRIQHGHCVLVKPAPWSQLLRCDAPQVVTIDWQAAYGAVIELLRTLGKASSNRFAADHPLVISAIHTTDDELDIAASGAERSHAPALDLLRSACETAGNQTRSDRA